MILLFLKRFNCAYICTHVLIILWTAVSVVLTLPFLYEDLLAARNQAHHLQSIVQIPQQFNCP